MRDMNGFTRSTTNLKEFINNSSTKSERYYASRLILIWIFGHLKSTKDNLREIFTLLDSPYLSSSGTSIKLVPEESYEYKNLQLEYHRDMNLFTFHSEHTGTFDPFTPRIKARFFPPTKRQVDLPCELWQMILEKLDVRDVVSCKRVNQTLNFYASDPFLWKKLLFRDFSNKARLKDVIASLPDYSNWELEYIRMMNCLKFRKNLQKPEWLFYHVTDRTRTLSHLLENLELKLESELEKSSVKIIAEVAGIIFPEMSKHVIERLLEQYDSRFALSNKYDLGTKFFIDPSGLEKSSWGVRIGKDTQISEIPKAPQKQRNTRRDSQYQRKIPRVPKYSRPNKPTSYRKGYR